MQKWVNSLTKSSDVPRTVIFAQHATGAGDKINVTPALREYKTDHPDHEIILITDEFSSDVFKNNPNIDYLVPFRSLSGWNKRINEKQIDMQWSFHEQHQYGHVCLSYMHHLVGETDRNYQMEMFRNDYDNVEINNIYDQLPKDKPFVGISPAYTMYNRMLKKNSWQQIVNKLIKKYTVLSFGNKTADFDLENVVDLRSQVKINQIPKLLDICDMIFTICSGFLHIAGCSDTKIIMLSVGEFPSELHVPYRQNELGWNSEIIEHDCHLKEKCYQGHITESIFQKQCFDNYKLYRDKYPGELIQKYTAWHYCAKKKNKYSCAKMISNKVVKLIKEGRFLDG
jgi:ADP-heptose:LPS heptosyltransferase